MAHRAYFHAVLSKTPAYFALSVIFVRNLVITTAFGLVLYNETFWGCNLVLNYISYRVLHAQYIRPSLKFNTKSEAPSTRSSITTKHLTRLEVWESIICNSTCPLVWELKLQGRQLLFGSLPL